VPAGVQLGTGVRLVSTHKQFTDGSMQNTSQQLDVAIVGNGFLQVLLSNGETAYTRAGQLQVDNEGRLVNANGLVVQPEITIPAETKSVSISATGRVSAMVGTESTPQELGALQLASFVNPAGLVAQGENLYLVSQASGDAVLGEPGEAGFGTLRQFALESSNVQAVEEMVDMISAQRSYEMNTKVLSAADDMMRNLAQAS
jgi:flagellar basal-body rod protein FlgG